MIYLDNASTGIRDLSIQKAQAQYLQDELEIGGPMAAANAFGRLEKLYADATELLNAPSGSIAVTTGANSGLQTLLAALRLKRKARVLVDRQCWGGTLAMLSTLHGIHIEVLPCNESGTIDLETTKSRLQSGPDLVILTWAPATNGILNPAEALGELTSEYGVTYIVDAAQVVGQRDVDVQALKCDALVATGRKWLCGPRGTGFIYASEAFRSRSPAYLSDQFGMSLLEGTWTHRHDARAYELGERSIAAHLGLRVAIDLALEEGIGARSQRIQRAAQLFREKLTEFERVSIQDYGQELSGIVTLTVNGIPANDVVAYLRKSGVQASAKFKPYAPLDMAARGLEELVRLSPHWTITDDEIERVVFAFANLESV